MQSHDTFPRILKLRFSEEEFTEISLRFLRAENLHDSLVSTLLAAPVISPSENAIVQRRRKRPRLVNLKLNEFERKTFAEKSATFEGKSAWARAALMAMPALPEDQRFIPSEKRVPVIENWRRPVFILTAVYLQLVEIADLAMTRHPDDFAILHLLVELRHVMVRAEEVAGPEALGEFEESEADPDANDAAA